MLTKAFVNCSESCCKIRYSLATNFHFGVILPLDLSWDIKLMEVQIHPSHTLRHVRINKISSFPLPKSVNNWVIKQKLLAKQSLNQAWHDSWMAFYSTAVTIHF